MMQYGSLLASKPLAPQQGKQGLVTLVFIFQRSPARDNATCSALPDTNGHQKMKPPRWSG